MKTVNIQLNKNTLEKVYNQVAMLNDMGFPNFQKGEPINDLMKEVMLDLKKQKKMSWLSKQWRDISG